MVVGLRTRIFLEFFRAVRCGLGFLEVECGRGFGDREQARGIVVFFVKGPAPFVWTAERVLGRERWRRLAERLGRKPDDGREKEKQDKPAKPTRLPPAPKQEPTGDSRDAAAQSLRKFFRNMR